MLAKWKKKCLHDYSVAHLISLCDGELKHFTAITVSALVVTLIITCVPNQIKISISMVYISHRNDTHYVLPGNESTGVF